MSDAAARDRQPRRISIVGATGSGKSHLARELARKTGLPVHELDTVRRSDADHFEKSVEALTAADGWIIDGHYRDVRHLIWRRADTVLWLNYSPALVAARLLRRFAAKRRQPSEQARGAEPAKASWRQRLGRLSRTVRERRDYGRVLCSSEYRGLTVVELRSASATEEWLRRLGS